MTRCQCCNGTGADLDAEALYSVCLHCGGTGVDPRRENAELGFGFAADDEVEAAHGFYLSGRMVA